MIRLTPRINEIVDRRHRVLYPFFGPSVSGGSTTGTRAKRAGGVAAGYAGRIAAERAGSIRAGRGRP